MDRDSAQARRNQLELEQKMAELEAQQRDAIALSNFARVAKFHNPCEILQGCEAKLPCPTKFLALLTFSAAFDFFDFFVTFWISSLFVPL